jgi:hypothetical protein
MPPMYFMERRIGEEHETPITHPEFYYGFVGVVFAWQVAFLIMAYDPVRFRPLMLPAMLEKFLFPAAIGTLLALGRGDELMRMMPVAAVVDLVLGVLIVMSWWKTRDDS